MWELKFQKLEFNLENGILKDYLKIEFFFLNERINK